MKNTMPMVVAPFLVRSATVSQTGSGFRFRVPVGRDNIAEAVSLPQLVNDQSSLLQANGLTRSASVTNEFNKHAESWEQATSIHSASSEIYLQRDYLAIMSKGIDDPAAYVPLILNRLMNEGGDWFFALERITGANPAAECEHFNDAVKAWSNWAVKRGFLKESTVFQCCVPI